jgi:hypothetical protein
MEFDETRPIYIDAGTSHYAGPGGDVVGDMQQPYDSQRANEHNDYAGSAEAIPEPYSFGATVPRTIRITSDVVAMPDVVSARDAAERPSDHALIEPRPYDEEPAGSQLRLGNLGHELAHADGAFRRVVAEDAERSTYNEGSIERQAHDIAVGISLERTREALRESLIPHVHGPLIDEHLGIRGTDSIVPARLRVMHAQAERTAGQRLSFTTWMADHASDEQLLDVLRWHDSYLTDLDNDPAFQNRVASARQGVVEGITLSIDSSDLHPDIMLTEADVQAVDIFHGSPLSPFMAQARGYVDQRLPHRIQVRDDFTDYDLFHELFHSRFGGLDNTVDEGVTDILATEAYNRIHPEAEHNHLDESVYSLHIAVAGAYQRLSGGRLNTRELSRLYAGPDGGQNAEALMDSIDQAVGMSVTWPLLECKHRIAQRAREMNYSPAEVQTIALNSLVQLANIMADAIWDNGQQVAYTAQQYSSRFDAPEIQANYSETLIELARSFTPRLRDLNRTIVV